jgi:hypothetical protein
VSFNPFTVLRRPIDAVFRPSEIVRTPPTYESSSPLRQAWLSVRLLGFFVLNLFLYTLPLSLAGVGTIDPSTTPPSTFEAAVSGLVPPQQSWVFLLRVVQNSLFLFLAAAITFAAFHVGIVLIRRSAGVIRSLRVITYSSSFYLATVFTLVWLTATNPGVAVADDLLLSVQSDVVFYFIETLDASLTLPGGPIARPPLSELTSVGVALLAALVIATIYYTYVLYLGARKTHGTTRLESVFVVVFVAVSPTLYIMGSILIIELSITVPDLFVA